MKSPKPISRMNNVQKTAIKLFFGNVKECTTDQFYYHKSEKSFSQEASTLDKTGQFYNTIKMTNPKTNNFRIFTYYKTNSNDNEITSWEYKTDDNIFLKIWND